MLKISVVVPSYNQGRFLEETILSILGQQYPLLEIIIVDGGSKDNSVDIIKKYENRITAWVSEKDDGQSDAINKGLKLCTGEIVSWLGSDDLYTPGTLIKVNELFSSLPESIGVIHGSSEIFNSEGIIRIDKGYPDWSIERQLAGMTFPQPSSFIRKTALDKSGILNSSLHYGMDYDLFSRLIMVTDFKFTDNLFSKYRLHDESKSTKAIAKFIGEWIIIFNSIAEGLKLESINAVLEKYKLKPRIDENSYAFFSNLKSVKKFDPDKMLYYLLVNVIRYDYECANFGRAKKIGNILEKNYSNQLQSEPEIRKIINRARFLPAPLIKAARKLKRSLMKQ